MAFVMSSLQHPGSAFSIAGVRRMPPAMARTHKRRKVAQAIPVPAPVAIPAPTITPPGPTVLDAGPAASVLAPYVSANGLGPLFAHPRLAPGMLRTQRALDLGEPTDQHESGRCWIFASLNWLRQHVRAAYGKDFQYSQNYVAYWDKVERANTVFNRMMAATDEAPDGRNLAALGELFTDGGTWEFFYNVVQKYGVVPDYAMPETRLAGQSFRYMRLLQRRVHEIGGLLHSRAIAGAAPAELEAIKAQGMQEVRQTLNLCLGTPPEKFLWQDPIDPTARWKEMTPQTFLAQNPAKLDDMVLLTSYPQHPAHTRLVYDDVTNMDGAPVSRGLNVPMSVMKQAIRRSLRAGEAVLSYSDTASLDEKHELWSLSTDQSAALLGIDTGLRLAKGDRVRYRVSGATHAMMFSGCDHAKPRKYEGGPLRDAEAELVEPLWQVENSWGGSPMYMTDRWVDNYVYGVIVNKQHLAAAVRREVEDPALPTEHLAPWSASRPTLS